MKLYKVFTAGKYKQGDVTEDDLKQIADNYDPEYMEAPLTLNHKSDGPSLGWVNKVVAKGKDLFVGFNKVTDKAKELTGSGEYKRPSIEIANYEGKGKYLRAVSLVLFPAVKGLPEMQFKTVDGEAVIYFSEGEINFNNDNNNKMDTKKYAEKLGLEQSATVEELFTAYDNRISALETEVTNKETELKKFQETRIESLVQNALSTGKILESQKESIKTFAVSNLDACQKYIDSLPVNSIYKKDEVNKKSKNGEDGKKVTYEEIMKDPTLQKNFSEEEIAELRSEYLQN